MMTLQEKLRQNKEQKLKERLGQLPKVDPEKLKKACKEKGKIASVNIGRYKQFKERHADGSIDMELPLRFYPITDLSHANNFDTFVVLDGNGISAYPRIAWTADNGKSWYMTACNDYPIQSPLAYAKLDDKVFTKLGELMWASMASMANKDKK